MTNSISNLRISYETDGLRRRELATDPFTQFGLWLQQAIDSGGILESNAMTLATATEDGFPSARMVLLKEFNEQGFVFYTNYDSQKAHELAENPQAALLFHWGELHRQVRIVGTVAKVSLAESAEYFHSRPLGSQLGAWASRQSEVIANRDVLEAELARLTELYQGQTVPLPPHWGGYRLSPTIVEFWQGRPDRLHDRFRYSRQADNSWLIERLSP
jgi:pyridoxamine 5'-phosphate oxidase